MTTKILRKEPDSPSVKLYLDDVQEISEMVAKGLAVSDASQVNTIYRVDRAFECTTIAELEQHGGVAKQFEIVFLLNDQWCATVTMENFIGLYIGFPIEDTPAAQDMSRQFRLIVESRKRVLLTLLRQLHGNGIVLVTSLAIVFGCMVPAQVVKNSYLRGMLYVPPLLVLLFNFLIFYSLSIQHNIVNLWFKRARERKLEEKRAERIEKLALLLAGAILGTISTLIAQHFKR